MVKSFIFLITFLTCCSISTVCSECKYNKFIDFKNSVEIKLPSVEPVILIITSILL